MSGKSKLEPAPLLSELESQLPPELVKKIYEDTVAEMASRSPVLRELMKKEFREKGDAKIKTGEAAAEENR